MTFALIIRTLYVIYFKILSYVSFFRILIMTCLLHCCFEGILGKMECLPVGYSETLTFWIQGQTSCPTYSVTVTVVPMVGR